MPRGELALSRGELALLRGELVLLRGELAVQISLEAEKLCNKGSSLGSASRLPPHRGVRPYNPRMITPLCCLVCHTVNPARSGCVRRRRPAEADPRAGLRSGYSGGHPRPPHRLRGA
eukprot:1191873-Prorocentrum_minimum.AAC.9